MTPCNTGAASVEQDVPGLILRTDGVAEMCSVK